MSEKRQRGALIQARVTVAERDTIEAAALRVGKTVPDFVRHAVLRAAEMKHQSPSRNRALAVIVGTLVDIKNNVEALHREDAVKMPLSVMARIIEELRQLRRAVVEKVDKAERE